MLRRSPSGTSSFLSFSISTSISLVTGTDSPVSAASSTFMEWLSMMRQSAGTASPASKITISPMAMSSLLTVTTLPSRSTWEVAAVISISASMAASALLSCTRLMMVLMMTTTRMTSTSAKSPTVGLPPASSTATTA